MRVLATDKDGRVIEVIDWDRSQTLHRPHADRLIEANARPEIGLGWQFTPTGWVPPEGVSHGTGLASTGHHDRDR